MYEMKKAAALCLTAFYLLLTSGMFVCAVHCTTEKLVNKQCMQMAGTPGKCCADKSKGDGCCKKHGNFVIKENVKPGYQIRFSLPLLTFEPVQPADLIFHPTAFAPISSLNNGNDPPGESGKAMSIRFCSLLI